MVAKIGVDTAENEPFKVWPQQGARGDDPYLPGDDRMVEEHLGAAASAARKKAADARKEAARKRAARRRR